MTDPADHPTPPVPRFPAWVMGHRGAHGVMPDNSIRGFGWAIRHGLQSVELDVRLTRDGVLVCTHDESLESHGGPSGAIAGLSAAIVDRAVLRTGVGVPRLTEVLDLAHDRLALNIEIKNPHREASFDHDRRAAVALADLLEGRTGTAGQDAEGDQVLAVSSFDAESVARFAEASPTFGHTAALLTPPGRDVRQISEIAGGLGLGAVHPHYTSLMVRDACARLAQDGFIVRTWTVNSRMVAERLVRLGVQTIVTDDPRRIATRQDPQPGRQG